MTKAQRILGAADLSIDAPRQWDESSASGISVSISERTATTSTSTATTAYRRTPPLEPNDNGPRPTRNVNRWEVESETVPSYVHAGRPHADDTATSRDYMSDASSLRRRQSSSTLKSWYDKSKMPLSISQQTSSSAMAKGLPSKASALLDVDGTSGSPSDAASTISASTARAAKRPSRLNLAHLFSSSSSTGRLRDSAFVRPSPSSSSLRSTFSSTAPTASPDTAYSTPPSPLTPRRLLRKPTKERLAEVAAAAAAANVHRPRSSSSNGAHGAKSTGTSTTIHCPRDLYDHYERTAFRNVLESPAEEELEDDTEGDLLDDDAAATRLLISDFPAAPVGPTALKSPPQQQHNPPQHQLPPHPLHPRHSTASSSFTTNSSNPVIREPIRRTTAASSTRSRQSTAETLPSLDHDYPSSLASVSSRHTKTSRHTTTSTGDSDRQGRSVLSLSSDSEGDSDVDNSYDASSRRSVPSIASQQQQPPLPHYRETPSSPASRRSVCSRSADSDSASRRSGGKRTSLATTAGSTYLTVPGGGSPSSLKPTAFSPRSSSVNKTQPQQPPSYGVHEARAVTVRPVASTARSLSSVDVDVTVDDLDVTTAPASLRAGDQPTPPLSPSSVEFCLQPDMTFDAASHTAAGTSSNPRLMAVTRQEQMLLAALRNKRAMMRETMLAEAEGDLQKQQQRQLRGHRHTSSQATIRGSDETQQQHRVLRHQGSATSTSSTVKSAPRLTSPPRRQLPPKPVAYVEPSPDLSDFMDFDDSMSVSGSDDDRRRPFYSSSGSGSGGSSTGDMLAPPAGSMTRKKAVRLSAVGTAGPEVDCWGDDG
ncbi:hypothetical protein F5X68DRAFT_187009 [Plectosphaerella plurivora]|uniref:Uncharacterized protein n=1 Tax=Plectosphaerella plurivora TaxID=936078 RepID=A0A9P9ACM6_9PEZI|nr:hypothetical protein F5X68DRAFT_187009 [Plectosphaerella plurivora]